MDRMFSLAANISVFHLNILFILGLALFGGTIGGRFFEKIKIPQVVGYIVIGLLLGDSGIGLIDISMIEALQPFNYFALGLIGFMIGGELKKEVLVRYGKRFMTILMFEGLFSFVLVTVIIGLAGSILLGNAHLAWALGILLGAISSATAPAATTDVLWEHKAKGPLTTTVFGLVALDDVLGIALFAVATTLATRILGVTHESVLSAVIHPLYEIGGAVIVGAAAGFVLVKIIDHYQQKERVLVFMIGMVMFVLGLSVALNLSMLLAAMVLGVVVINSVPHVSKQAFDLAKDFAPPIFILFFVFIGAKVNLRMISPILVVFICLYLIGRTVGKMGGAYLGAVLAGAEKPVRNFLPFCLFSQAGIAVGLSIVAAQLLQQQLADTIIIVITLSTFIVQIIGPPCVKFAIDRSGESGKNVTEGDIMRSVKVRELMDTDYPLVYEDMPASEVLNIFSSSPYTQYPVVSRGRHLTGAITIDSIKNSLIFGDTIALLLGTDLKERYEHTINADASLYEAKQYMDKYFLGFLPVIDHQGKVIGGFDRRMYKKLISEKLLHH